MPRCRKPSISASRTPSLVDRIEILGDGDQRPQEVAEGQVDRRTVVERTRAQTEEEPGGFRGASGEKIGERRAAGRHRPSRRRRRGRRGTRLGAPHVGAEVGIEDRRDQDRAPEVRLVDVLVDVVGIGRLPSADRRPRSAPRASPNCWASWTSGLVCSPPRRRSRRLRRSRRRCGPSRRPGQLGLVEPPAGQPDRVGQRLLVREVGEQRGEVGEAFMEGQHVGIGRLGEVRADAVDDGMRHLVGDDVVRQAGEDALAGQVAALIGLVGA